MTTPTLSICIPTLDRPIWLKRAILSVTRQHDGERVELIISDNSPGPESRDVVNECMADWPGPWKYLHNETMIPMVENFNQAISHSSGRYVLMLSDDDFILPGALEPALKMLDADVERAVCLFGVHVVDGNERVINRRSFVRERYLTPLEAVDRILSNSSFVRFPGVIIDRSLLQAVGMFDSRARNMCDLDLWFKLFSRHGLHCMPVALSAYTVHQKAHTMTMFRTEMLELLLSFFEKVEATDITTPAQLQRYKSLFFHQYILAGTYRSLRWNGPDAARKAFSLFKHDGIRGLSVPVKWMPLRLAFGLLLSARGDQGASMRVNG